MKEKQDKAKKENLIQNCYFGEAYQWRFRGRPGPGKAGTLEAKINFTGNIGSSMRKVKTSAESKSGWLKTYLRLASRLFHKVEVG